MENSEKKKKKKFSLFCCFSTNDGSRRKKKKERLQSFTGNKTNISDQNASIKLNEFAYEENQQKFKNEKIEVNKIIQKDDTNRDIKTYIKNNNIIKNEKNNNNKKSLLNKTTEDNNLNMKLSIINSNNKNMTIIENKDILNLYKIKINITNITSVKEEINNNRNKIISNKEEINKKEKESNFISDIGEISYEEKNENITINPIPIKRYQKNNLDDNKYINNKIMKKINTKINGYFQQNINVYNNNDNYLSKIKEKDKKKQKDKNKNDLLLKPNLISNNNLHHKNNNKNTFTSITNVTYPNKVTNNKIKLNISTLNNKINKQKYTYLNNNPIKKNKSYTIYNTNILNCFPYELKNLKTIRSAKLLIQKVKLENIELLFNTKKLISKNHIKVNLKFKTQNDDSKNNIFNDDEEIKKFIPESIRKNNKTIFKKKLNKLPLTKIGKKLLSINENNSFINNPKNVDKFYNKYDMKDNSPENENINKLQNISKLKEQIDGSQLIENNNSIINKSIINKKSKEEDKKDEEDIKDLDIETDQDNKLINDDMKSIISNNIFFNNQGIYSYAPSLCSKSELKDNNISNLQDLTNSRLKYNTPIDLNETEIEIMNENEKMIKSFLVTPRTMNYPKKRLTHKNFIYNSGNKSPNNCYNIYNRSMTTCKLKNIYDKINYNCREIEKMNEKISELDKKIKIYEEYDKNYKLWIEKEETETEYLTNILNYIYSNNK